MIYHGYGCEKLRIANKIKEIKMNVKDAFLAFVDVFEGLGKEVFALTVLGSGLVLLCKGMLTGQEYVDAVKDIGCAYMAGAAVGSTSDALIKHLESKVALLREKSNGS
jgi:hypothetical protein